MRKIGKLRVVSLRYGAEDIYVPLEEPELWPRPETILAAVEPLGGEKPTEEIIRRAEIFGWTYNPWDGRFYPT